MKRHSQLRANITIVVGIVVLCVSTATGELWKTTDTGTIWLRENTCTNWALYDAGFPEPGTGYAVGAVDVVIKTGYGGAVEDECPLQWPHSPMPATLLSGAAFRLPGNRAARFLDISGWKVAELVPGVNDVRHLAPGVYFVRLASSVMRDASGVSKVMILK